MSQKNRSRESDNTLQSLVEKARKGDSGAFEEIVGRSSGSLEKYIRARIGKHLQARIEVEDVLQETYGRAWKSLENFQWSGEESFLQWLKVTAEHVILKAARLRPGNQILYVAQRDAKNVQPPTPSKELRRGERFDRLRDAINRLPPEYREAILLVRIEGLQIKEAAERMNRSPKSVMHLVARALKKLKVNFGDTESLHLPPRRLSGGVGEEDA